MARKGGERRRWINASSSFRDEQRRRSPRFSLPTSSTPHPPHQNGKSSKPSRRSSLATSTGSGTSTRKRATGSKGLFGSMDLCDSHDDDDDDDDGDDDDHHLGMQSQSFKHKLKLFPALSLLKQDERAALHDNRSINDASSINLALGMQSKEGQCHEDHHGYTDDTFLPERRILEVVLDTLQRRDTYEIFAEPVDPSEVEEYYEIIKEPMDFGTMRAKLHEGMYKNLQQFERDVFLIFGNAMHFNSSATVYFRQARVLEDLAKKIFHVLRTDLENFELELAAIRQRSRRRVYGELKGSNFEPCKKIARDLGSNSMSSDVGLKGFRRERRPFMTGVDRRCTYKPWCDDAYSTVSPLYNSAKALEHVNRNDIGYKESLMSFVKDLGPTAQRVAKHKLQGLWMPAPPSPRTSCTGHTTTSNCHTSATQSPFQREPNHIDIKKVYNVRKSSENKSREAPNDGKLVENLGFSRFLDTTPAFAGLSSCSLTDQGDTNKRIHQNTSSSHFGVNTRRPAQVKESNHIQVDNFDLNQVDIVSSSGLVTREVSSSSPGDHARIEAEYKHANNIYSPGSGRFIFNLPYLKSRLRELNHTHSSFSSTGVGINRQLGPGKISWPFSTNMSSSGGSR